MKPIQHYIDEAKAMVYDSLYPSCVTPELSKPIFSFTFDDVPSSAAGAGATILEDKGLRGTFYISSKLCLPNNERPGKNAGPGRVSFASMETVVKLFKRGHQIGCHTYSHESLDICSAAEMAEDSRKNRLILNEALGGKVVEHFSFPFGKLSLTAKNLLKRDYKTIRSTRAGINSGKIDLSMLKAVNIYSSKLNREALRELIAKNSKASGWLIFYTHGVEPNPNGWGTAPDDLLWIINECLAAGGDILNVEQAYNTIMAGLHKPKTKFLT